MFWRRKFPDRADKHSDIAQGSRLIIERLPPRILLSADLPGIDLFAPDRLPTFDHNIEQLLREAETERLLGIETRNAALERISTSTPVESPSQIQDATDIPGNEHTITFEQQDVYASLLQPFNSSDLIEESHGFQQPQYTEIVFIDMAVEDYETLVAGVSENVQTVFIDPNSDGLVQMSKYLDSQLNVSTIHWVTYGSQAQLQIGSDTLSLESMSGIHADELRAISRSLMDDAEILIYGCDFGQGEIGLQALQTLAALTGADIAASDDRTGADSLGGDWDLEVHVGSIDSAGVFDDSSKEKYSKVLDINQAPTLTGLGTPSFVAHELGLTTDAVNSVTTADVDDDGDVDILSASQGDNTIIWHENDGSENFTTHTIDAAANGAAFVSVADVDGDGDVDVLSASNIDNQIAWYENDGSENFSTRIITTNAEGAMSVNTADVDGDGDLDVLAASQDDDTIAWYQNDGSENFTVRIISTNADGARAVATADVDGDGDLDVLSGSSVDSTVAWYENDGGENFTAAIVTTNTLGVNSIKAVDVDGDGDIDVLAASSDDDKVAWFANDGGGNFTEHVIATDLDGAISIDAADFDDDGDWDVFSVSPIDNKIVWYENDGNENFNLNTIITDSVLDVALADVDADGDVDVLSAPFDDGRITWYETDLNPPVFLEGGPAVILDTNVGISDVELDSFNSGYGNYDGAIITLMGAVAVSSDDTFAFKDGNGIAFSENTLTKNSQIIATFDTTTTAGVLRVTFSDASGETPTSIDVNNILRQIVYENVNTTPPDTVQIEWTFSDGNSSAQGSGGAANAFGSTTINIIGNSIISMSDVVSSITGAPTAVDILGNDSQAQGELLSITEIIDTANGDVVSNLYNVGDTATLASGTKITLRSDGRLDVVSSSDGVETFDYRVSDGTGSETQSVTMIYAHDQAIAEAIGFVTTWDTTLSGSSAEDTIELKVHAGSDDFTIHWGDGHSTSGASGNISHTYNIPGNYTIAITGDFSGFAFYDSGDIDKLTSIEQWGNVAFENWSNGFDGADNVVYNASDTPDLSGVNSLVEMFKDSTFNGDISGWDTSHVVNMESVFINASMFNQDISGWDTSRVTNMGNMFYGATTFDQDISGWNTSNVTNMVRMFFGATAFNQNLAPWDTGNVTNMSGMFYVATSFDQPIGGWNTENVTDMSNMFRVASSFNQEIGSWNTAGVTSMFSMFSGAGSFNQDISAWITHGVTDMSSMFQFAQAFDQNLESWNISNVRTMSDMLYSSGVSIFNYDALLNGWANQSVQTGVELGAAGLFYSEAASNSRSMLTGANNWTVIGDTQINRAPTFETMLNVSPNYIESSLAVQLVNNVSLADTDLDGRNSGNGNYTGSTITLHRIGGANSDDVLSFIDNNGIILLDGTLLNNSNVIALFDTVSTVGELVITFLDEDGEPPTTADVNNILRQITYENKSDTPPSSIQLEWDFNDGSAGTLGVEGAFNVVGSTMVTITATNDVPIITSNGGMETALLFVSENQVQVTNILSTDADINSAPIISISGGADATKFTVNESTGSLVFTVAPDYENQSDSNTDGLYQVEITVADSFGGVDTQLISVSVTDLNEAPTITSSNGEASVFLNVVENQSVVTSIAAIDADAGDMPTFSVSGGADQQKFVIDRYTGELSFVFVQKFESYDDSNLDGVYEVQIAAEDGNGGRAIQSLFVTVTPEPILNAAVILEGVEMEVNSFEPIKPSLGLTQVQGVSTAIMAELEVEPESDSQVTEDIGPEHESEGESDAESELESEANPDSMKPVVVGDESDFTRSLTAAADVPADSTSDAVIVRNNYAVLNTELLKKVAATKIVTNNISHSWDELSSEESNNERSDTDRGRALSQVKEYQDAAEVEERREEIEAFFTTGLSVSVTAGLVSWMLNSGSMAASLLASMPAWRQLDMLAILSTHDISNSDLDSKYVPPENLADDERVNELLRKSG